MGKSAEISRPLHPGRESRVSHLSQSGIFTARPRAK